MQTSIDLLFDPSEDAAIHWAARTGLEHALDLRTAEQLYARALPYLKTWAWALTTKHGWTQDAVDTVGDMPLAVCIGRDELIQGDNGDISYVARLVLPANFSDLLNPEFTHDWAAMFSHLTNALAAASSTTTDIFDLGRAGFPRPLQNILYLLQVLSPGLVLVRSVTTDDDEPGAEWGPQGIDLVALPPSIWVGLHIEDLEDIFGAQTAVKLYQAAEDPYCSSEDASSASSYGSQDAFDSYTTLDSAHFEDSWNEFEFPTDFARDEDALSFQSFQEPASYLPAAQESAAATQDSSFLAQSGQHLAEHHLISEFDGKDSNLMEYRHCDADCNYCGMCSSRFAERLTERLLMHGSLLTF